MSKIVLDCQVRSSNERGHPHGGDVRVCVLSADSQPPGRGGAQLDALVVICDAHREEYFPGDWETANIRVNVAGEETHDPEGEET